MDKKINKIAKVKKSIQISKRGNKKLISFKNITKSFGHDIVLRGITFDVYEGDFITILGPSGCGKSTTLKLLSGFLNPDSGLITYEGKDLTKIPSFDRPFNTVFQNYALFPNMNVYDNIAYGLKLKKIHSEEIQKLVTNILKKVKMEKFSKRDVLSLSGGQKQRVAIARALVNEPKILLLDEPLGALDVKIKKEMQEEIKRLHEELGITFIYVTHDQEEALSLSDTVIVMNDGWIEQLGDPEDIYNEPENIWVAQFIGEVNVITSGIFVKDNLVKFGNKEFKCLDSGFGIEEKIDIAIRPEDIKISLKNQKAFFEGKIQSSNFQGIHYEYLVSVKNKNFNMDFLIQTTKHYDVQTIVYLKWDIDAIHVMWKEDHEYVEE